MRSIQTIAFWLFLLVAAVIAALCETGMVVLYSSVGDTEQYWTVLSMELITIVLLPMAAFLLKMHGVRADIKKHGATALLRWSLLRLCMVGLPLVANTVLYYVFVNVSFGYLAIMGAIFMAFVRPVDIKEFEQ